MYSLNGFRKSTPTQLENDVAASIIRLHFKQLFYADLQLENGLPMRGLRCSTESFVKLLERHSSHTLGLLGRHMRARGARTRHAAELHIAVLLIWLQRAVPILKAHLRPGCERVQLSEGRIARVLRAIRARTRLTGPPPPSPTRQTNQAGDRLAFAPSAKVNCATKSVPSSCELSNPPSGNRLRSKRPHSSEHTVAAPSPASRSAHTWEQCMPYSELGEIQELEPMLS